MPVTPALKRLRQEDCEFKANFRLHIEALTQKKKKPQNYFLWE
jgi:hypothetical protein